MKTLAAKPISLPEDTASLSISPVDTCGFEVKLTILLACVPLPAPGGPNNTIEPFITLWGKVMVISQTQTKVDSAPTTDDHKIAIDP